VQRVAVVLQRHPGAGHQLGDVDVLVDVDHVLALGVRLDQHLVLAHDLGRKMGEGEREGFDARTHAWVHGMAGGGREVLRAASLLLVVRRGDACMRVRAHACMRTAHLHDLAHVGAGLL